jgi:hypothetical protein
MIVSLQCAPTTAFIPSKDVSASLPQPPQFTQSTSALTASSSSNSRGEGDEVLLQLLQRKKYEIAELERKHSASMDPLQLRLGYVSDTSSLRLTRALRLFKLGDDRRVAVVSKLFYGFSGSGRQQPALRYLLSY